MSQTSPNLHLPYILPAQAQKHVTHNESLDLLDVLVRTTVLGRDATTPPAAPDAGETWALGAAPTGDWAGHPHSLASFNNGGWVFVHMVDGTLVWDLSGPGLHIWSQDAWVSVVAEGSGLASFGINATADATNRLAVGAEAVLFSHDGADHQLKLNKALPSDTVSLVFQSGFSGRAEMGLAGDDAFSIKVSPDGAAWVTSVAIDGTSGQITGAAVQGNKIDTTGTLARADFVYGPGNLLGNVTMNGAYPDGAVIERGTSASGDFVKWADGTMIATWNAAQLNQATADTLTGTWTFPQWFAAAPTGSLTLPTEPADWTDTQPVNIGPSSADSSVTAVDLTLHRTAGGTAFAGTASIANVRLIAIGTWG